MQTLGAKPARKKLSDRIEEMHGICISDMNYCTGHLVEFNCGSSLQIPPNTVLHRCFWSVALLYAAAMQRNVAAFTVRRHAAGYMTYVCISSAFPGTYKGTPGVLNLW